MIEYKFFTPNGTIKAGKANHIQVNHEGGSFGILENHVPIISIVNRGFIEIDGDNQEFIAVSGAIFKFQNNSASITAEAIEVGESGIDALNKLDETLKLRQNENRERNIELALAENELKKQIKKTGAGSL